MTVRLLATARPGGVLAATATAACALAVLAGTGAATAHGLITPPPPPLSSPSPPPVDPRPDPRWFSPPLAGGVKMNPVPGPGVAVNDQPSHPAGDWYPAAAGSVNPVAARNFVLRTDVGHYLLWFPGMQPAGAVTVVTSTSVLCTVGEVTASPGAYAGTDVAVTCTNSYWRGVGATFTVSL